MTEPLKDAIIEDPRVADSAYWDGLQVPEAATDPDDIELIRKRREAYMAGKNPDAPGSPLRVGS